jgi:hypothetical protein
MPVEDAAFDKVKAEGKDPATALALSASAVVVPDGEAAIVVVDIGIVDDLGIGRAFVLVDGDDREVARAPIDRPQDATGDAWTKVHHRFSGFPVEGLTARLLDKHGNLLRRTPVVVDDAVRAALSAAGATPATPSTATTTTTTPVTALSYVGAGTAVAGLVGAAGSGIALAIRNHPEGGGAVGDTTPLLIGFFGGVAVTVVGAVLVVVDQLPPG